MTVNDILSQLKALHNKSTFAHNLKDGANSNNQFGVKLGDVRTLAKKLKAGNELALELWKTFYLEARLVAILLMEPKSLSTKQIEALAKTLHFVQVADGFNAYVLKNFPQKEQFTREWMNAENVWLARSGWSLLAEQLAKKSADINGKELLTRIENEMPKAAPQVQWTMNTTLAQLGIHYPEYRSQALALGEKLGIYRDYPVSKGCTSPFAPIWINEIVKRQK